VTRHRFQLWIAVAGLLFGLLIGMVGAASGQEATQPNAGRSKPSPEPARLGVLRLVVKDPSGAVIPDAQISITGVDRATEGLSHTNVVSDRQGVAVSPALVPGRYGVQVSFPGFETYVIPDLRVRAGESRREVVLSIQRVDESVAVGRDPATSASDPNAERLGNTLSKEQIDALPDDPDEMETMLKEMAGPGATIRVDGFRGAKLPPKAQIRSIRFASGMFAAENHGGGFTFVDIMTQPGLGPMQGSVDFTFRDDALNARNALQSSKGPEQTQQYTLNLSGTLLKERTSFSLSAGGAALYDSANIFAARADGSRNSTALRRPSDRINFTARVDHALTKSHTLRGSLQRNTNDQRNLGVGGFDLADRAYGRTTSESVLRLAESGPWRRSLFGESRLQVRWSDSQTASAVEAQTIRVLDAFTVGGAQQAGGRRSVDLEWASNLDWTRGKHAVKMGALIEAGWYRSDNSTNYLGTYTFASLADYEARRASTFTRREGDPLVEYSHWQTGLFIQDDWRARKNLTLSGGLRQEMQAHLGDTLNLAPRGGFTWSPFKHGKTTIRGGGGIFYDWLEAEVYEQTLRVDGLRQQDVIVLDAGFPNPFDGGSSQVLPTSKYQLDSAIVMPKRNMINVGMSQQLAANVGLNVMFMHMRGSNRFRGRDINAPLDGSRPDPTLGTITQVETTARMRGTHMMAGINFNVPSRRMFVFANYAFADQKNDADGPFSLPADTYNLAAEWGPTGVPRHSASAVVNMPLVAGIRLGLSTTARTGTPYNITTGRDDNGDSVFNDRPAGVGRNSARGKGMWDVAARISYAFGFGERRGDGPLGPPTMIIRRGPGADSAGDLLGGAGGGGADTKRIRIELFASALNLLNSVAYTGYSGVMTSPFFGQPTSAMPGRRIDLGMRVGF
jgi:hypothetical protein